MDYTSMRAPAKKHIYMLHLLCLMLHPYKHLIIPNMPMHSVTESLC